MAYLEKFELDQLAPLLSGLVVDEVPPSVLVKCLFLESSVNPDKSGSKLLGVILDGFDVVEFGVRLVAP